MNRPLILLGSFILLLGVLWPWISQLPFGRLPGDITIERPGLRIYFPWVSMLIVSVLMSLVLRWLRR